MNIQELIIKYKIREAFWAAAEDIADNKRNQNLFLQLLSFRNNVALLQVDYNRIKEEAERNCNPYMAFAYARLHDVLQTEQDSCKIARMHYETAAEHGIADAYAYLAYMYRDGDLGEQDMDSYEKFMLEAKRMQSEKALQQDIRNLVYGSCSTESNPLQAYEIAENHLKELDFPNPAYYFLMAEADLQLERRDNATKNFRAASEYGHSSAFYWWAMTECCNEQYEIMDKNRFMEIMQKGIDVRAADSFLMYSLLLDEKGYDSLNDKDKAKVSGKLLSDLKTGWMLGDSECAFFLARYYESGQYGFEQNYNEAWLWYSRGAVLRSFMCYEELVRMIMDDCTAPSAYDNAFAYDCAYKGVLLGSDDLLEVVIRGYRNGFLTNHAEMIERKWMPKYEQMIGDIMDDHEIDGDEYDDAHEYLYDGEPEREIEED